MNIKSHITFFLLFFLLSSCSPKKNFSHNDLEEIYNFKSKTIALSLVDGKIIKEFLEYQKLRMPSFNSTEQTKEFNYNIAVS